MMLLLTFIFLLSSIPFKGIALSCKVLENKLRVKQKIKDKKQKVKSTSDSKFKPKNILSKLKLNLFSSKLKGDSKNNGITLKGLMLKGLKNTMNSIALVLRVVSGICSLLIPFDFIITLLFLFYIAAAGAVPTLFFNDGLYASDSKTNKTSRVVIKNSNSSQSTTVSDNTTTDDNYTKTDLGWIYLSQNDARWGSYKHGINGETISDSACGVTCASMVLSHFNSSNQVYRPDNVTELYASKWGWSQFAYQTRDCIPRVINELYDGITAKCETATSGSLDFNKVDDVIAKGGCVIANFHAGDVYNNTFIWTSSGHYVLIYSGNQNTGYRVLDPNHGHESGSSGVKEWIPYTKHTFSKDYMKSANYWYLIYPKSGES